MAGLVVGTAGGLIEKVEVVAVAAPYGLDGLTANTELEVEAYIGAGMVGGSTEKVNIEGAGVEAGRMT